MNVKILPYKMGSASAKKLAEALGVKQVKHEGKDVRFQKYAIINWGCSRIPDRLKAYASILNNPEAISLASNKKEAFSKFQEAGVPIPEFTFNYNEAKGWLNGKDIVVCRTILNGHSGAGIILASTEEDLVQAPLYTKYLKKVDEWRLHVFDGEVFFVQRKARKREVPDENVNWQIRNHQNGFIYAHKDVEIKELFKEYAVKAIRALGLDFGAVDIIENKRGEGFILEVNTAPGLEGTTLEKYTNVFKQKFEG